MLILSLKMVLKLCFKNFSAAKVAKKVASFDKNAPLKILYLKIGLITGKGYNLLPIKLCLHAWSVQANY